MIGTAFALMTAAWTVLAAIPDTPTGLMVDEGEGQATFSWTDPMTGGTADDYNITVAPGPFFCTSSPPTTTCVVPGLTNGVTYAATVNAHNSDGTSPESSPVSLTPHVPLTIGPIAPSVAPHGTRTFVASGGSGGFLWSLTANPSGGTIDSAGLYTAGSTGSVTDTVQVQDSFGRTTTTTVSVTAGLTIVQTSPTLSPRGLLTFTTAGGSGTGNSWSLSTNGSGGSINGTTGQYTAGPTGSTSDIVRVQDSLGNVATVTVVVSAELSIVQTSPVAAPLGTVNFTAAGGSGTGRVWSIPVNASGATINATTGEYRAGASPSAVDRVQVTDSLGSIATVNVAVGLGLAINPAAPTVSPRATVQLSAAGGSGTGYVWSFLHNNSEGSLNATTGLYTAGPTGNVSDTIKVMDPLGNSETATVQVTSGLDITISAGRIRALDRVQLSVSGGSGTGYVWAIAVDGSGGSIDQSGLYLAGRKAGTDVVTVADSLGNQATVTLVVEATGQVSVGKGSDSGCSSVPQGMSPLWPLAVLRWQIYSRRRRALRP